MCDLIVGKHVKDFISLWRRLDKLVFLAVLLTFERLAVDGGISYCKCLHFERNSPTYFFLSDGSNTTHVVCLYAISWFPVSTANTKPWDINLSQSNKRI